MFCLLLCLTFYSACRFPVFMIKPTMLKLEMSYGGGEVGEVCVLDCGDTMLGIGWSS